MAAAEAPSPGEEEAEEAAADATEPAGEEEAHGDDAPEQATPAAEPGSAANGDQAAAGPSEEAAKPAAGRAKGKFRPPSILGELNLKVTTKGIVLPESYKRLKERWREKRARDEAAGILAPYQPPAALADAEGQEGKKRKTGKARQTLGVQLDDTHAALFHASVSGDTAACRAAVASGADVNVRTNADIDGIGTGGTALHIAAVRGHADVAAALLSAGASPTATTGRGEAPIQLATRMGHVDVVRLLKDVGASPKDAEGARRLLQKAPAWDERTKRQLMHAVLPNDRSNRRRGVKGDGKDGGGRSGGGKGGGKDAYGHEESSEVDRSQYWLTGFEELGGGAVEPDGDDHGWHAAGHEAAGKGYGKKGGKGKKGKKGKGGKGKKGA